ncbi:MAG TPA: hypothetical protein VJC39_00675 [Candidatus Nanoarchaeia archaeon]|nr:hypothetical protein [Candidatus Nanoarchaeia archaeon]
MVKAVKNSVLESTIDRILAQLSPFVDDVDPAVVNALLTLDRYHKRINVYQGSESPKLDLNVLFNTLNLTINTFGTRVTGTSNQSLNNAPKSYHRGIIVPGRPFAVPGYIALADSIPVSLAGDIKVYHYNLK